MSNPNGRFGVHGGQYVPETLMNAIIELEEAYNYYKANPDFQNELTQLLNDYAGRPSRLYYAEKMTKDLGGAKIYLKREDLNHTGAHKINNVLGQALLAKKMGKTRLIAETGAGQHGVATATAAALMGMLTGGRGHILPILGQQSGHYADSQRLTGFLEEMSANYPDIEILHPECCFLDGELAKRITCRAIQADPELNGIFVSSMGRRGVAKALQETGTAGKIHMIIHDITPSNLSLVRQCSVDFVIGQDIETQGTRPIQILYEYLSNHQMPEQRIQLTDISIKFRCNIPPEA